MHRDIEMTRTAARARKGDTGNAAKQTPAGSSGRSRFSDVRKKAIASQVYCSEVSHSRPVNDSLRTICAARARVL